MLRQCLLYTIATGYAPATKDVPISKTAHRSAPLYDSRLLLSRPPLLHSFSATTHDSASPHTRPSLLHSFNVTARFDARSFYTSECYSSVSVAIALTAPLTFFLSNSTRAIHRHNSPFRVHVIHVGINFQSLMLRRFPILRSSSLESCTISPRWF